MNRDDVIRMARKAGLSFEEDSHGRGDPPATVERTALDDLQRFAELVRNEVLEEAAKACSAVYYKHIGEGYAEVRYGVSACAKEIQGLKS